MQLPGQLAGHPRRLDLQYPVGNEHLGVDGRPGQAEGRVIGQAGHEHGLLDAPVDGGLLAGQQGQRGQATAGRAIAGRGVVVVDLNLQPLAARRARILRLAPGQVVLRAGRDGAAQPPVVDAGGVLQALQQTLVHQPNLAFSLRCGPPDDTGTHSFQPLPQLPPSRAKSLPTALTEARISGT